MARKSKKHYAANSPSPSPRSVRLFLDEGLSGPKVSDLLRNAQISVELHGQHFSPGELDTVWLKFVGENGWLVLTKDDRIRYRQLELDAIKRYGVHAFIMASGNMSGSEIAQAVIKAFKAMVRLSGRTSGYLIAKVYRDGSVKKI